MNDGPPRYQRVGVVDRPELVVDDGEHVIVKDPDAGEWWLCEEITE